MTKARRPRPWHEVVRMKDELRTGELALAEFAADLHEVALAQGRRPVYEDPAKFFALTYPTPALRELVRDVAARLSGVPAQALSAEALPGAWRDGETNGAALAQALSQSRRTTLLWGLVREGIRVGVESRWLEVAEGSAVVGCAYDQAGQLRLKRPAATVAPPRRECLPSRERCWVRSAGA